MLLHDLLEGVDVRERRGELAVDVRSVVHDSRDAAPGALFACIRGAVTDGHAHAAAAVDAGAVALLVEELLPVPVAQARVESVRAVLGSVAARFHGFPSTALRVLGVTGTNGKTTTTYLLESIARANGDATGVVGTTGVRIGDAYLPQARTTPEATDLQLLLAEMRGAGVTTVAMEVSSHALAQHRVDGTWFSAACFTNLSHDHLDYHGTIEAYFAAKARLFDRTFTDNAAVAIDDPYGGALYDRCTRKGIDVWSFGRHDADIAARDVEFEARHTHFLLHSRRDGRHAPVGLSLVGPFNLLNALAAAATARAAGLPFEAIVAGLERPIAVPGRMERVDAGQDFSVLVDYAHTPDALHRVLAAARVLTRPGGRLVVVFGCGGDRDRAKRPMMGAAAATGADVAVVTSDNPRSEAPEAIAAEIVAGFPRDRPPLVELDRRRAIRAAVAGARPGDVVVIAGKGHETGQTAGGVTVPFDDRVVAREELEAARCT